MNKALENILSLIGMTLFCLFILHALPFIFAAWLTVMVFITLAFGILGLMFYTTGRIR